MRKKERVYTRREWEWVIEEEIPSTLSKWNCNSVFICSIRNSLNINRMSIQNMLGETTKTNPFSPINRNRHRKTCSHFLPYIYTPSKSNWTTFGKWNALKFDHHTLFYASNVCLDPFTCESECECVCVCIYIVRLSITDMRILCVPLDYVASR